MTDTTTVRVTEGQAFAGPDYRLDKEAGVAFGVTICGPVSLNGRDYPDAVRDRDKHVYGGSNVFIDHSERERGVREWFGTLKNPRTRVGDRKTIADFHFPLKSGFTEEFIERATKFPRSFGFSHVALCESKRVNGRESITAIKRVESVDLVAKPATVGGLFESVVSEAVVVNPADVSVANAARKAVFDGLAGLLDDLRASKIKPAEYLAAAEKLLARLGTSEGVFIPKTGAEFRERYGIPTDGKAFADLINGRRTLTEAEQAEFMASLRRWS